MIFRFIIAMMSLWSRQDPHPAPPQNEARMAAVIVSIAPDTSQIEAGRYAAAISTAAQKYNIDWTIITALIWRESRFEERNISHTRDYGLGQHHCPSFFCRRQPTPAQLACLLDGPCNIDLTAQELIEDQKQCARMGKLRCRDFIQLYNPTSHGYSTRTRAVAAKIGRLDAQEKKQLGTLADKPVL